MWAVGCDKRDPVECPPRWTPVGEEGRTPIMQTYDVTTYGERMAEVYDQWPGLPQNTDAVVAALARLAGRGPILELGIGTGRIALPLAQRGLRVYGIEASPAMVAQLRA